MLNKKELLIVNEVVGKMEKDLDAEVIATENEIILKVDGLIDDIYTDRKQFFKEMLQCLKIDTQYDNEILRQHEAAEHMNILNVLLTGEKIKVTNNEFNQICKDLASKYYKNFSLYDALLDLYDIIPFTINTDNEQLKKVINFYCQTEEQREFNLNTIYDGGYNVSLYSDNLKLIVDYTEGDLNFSISDTQELYAAEKQRTIKFYNENY